MSLPLPLLGLLQREPSHGYDLKRDYDAHFGRGKQLPFWQVYATLARDAKVLGGKAQRVAVARALALGSKVVRDGLVSGGPGVIAEQVSAAKAATLCSASACSSPCAAGAKRSSG